jgi:hypothetical protein
MTGLSTGAVTGVLDRLERTPQSSGLAGMTAQFASR